MNAKKNIENIGIIFSVLFEFSFLSKFILSL